MTQTKWAGNPCQRRKSKISSIRAGEHRCGNADLGQPWPWFCSWRLPFPAAQQEPTPEEQREQLIIERFQQIVEQKPRRGTAFDRIYGHHVERGTLDQLLADYRQRTTKDADDGTAWLMIGMLESQRGHDAEAVKALQRAETARPDDAIAPYYLGQSLVLLGQPGKAAEAFERAIARNPSKVDSLEIYQALGRVYQRAQQPEKAIEVWNRLEKQFPNDERVQEQIARTLMEEGENSQALPRLEQLAKTTRDRYQKSLFRMEAAELKVKLNRRAEGLADLETMLDELEPSSWLYREVRSKIEEVFLRNDDLSGLADYYAKWLAAHPQDVDAMARLARNLGKQGRLPEARVWLQKAIPLAPTRIDLRQALIDQLVLEGDYAEVLKQYAELDKVSPNNPDIIREWGRMVLAEKETPEAERRKRAVEVWKKLLEKRPTDPTATAQVADLVRAAELPEEAIALYRKAIELAPESAQYREYLGEYLHSLKRKDEALAAWKPIAEGKNRNAKNLTRLAEVYAGFGYADEALASMADALQLEPDDFDLKVRYAALLAETKKYDDALKQLADAWAMAENDEERESVLQEQIKVFQLDSSLADRIKELENRADAREGTIAAPLASARFLSQCRPAHRRGQCSDSTIARARAGVDSLSQRCRRHSRIRWQFVGIGGNLPSLGQGRPTLPHRVSDQDCTIGSAFGPEERSIASGSGLARRSAWQPRELQVLCRAVLSIGLRMNWVSMPCVDQCGPIPANPKG